MYMYRHVKLYDIMYMFTVHVHDSVSVSELE